MGGSSFRPSASSAREPESSKHRTTNSRDPAAPAFDLGRIAARLLVKTTRGDYWIPALARKGSLGRNDDLVICIKPAKTGAVIVVSVLSRGATPELSNSDASSGGRARVNEM